jgi:Tripartite tricarboxylate transporter family receptor
LGILSAWIASESTPKLSRADRWSANIADVSLVQVPYRGGGPALTDLIAGQVQVVFLPPAIARLKPTS